MTNWRLNRWIAGLVIALFFALQLTVPIERLLGSESRRFGWQMYSSTDPAPDFTVSTPEGTSQIDLAAYTATVRADIAYENLIPPHLCAALPGVEQVTWEEGTFQC